MSEKNEEEFNKPFICTASPCHFSFWYVRLKEIIDHPDLEIDHKFLWLWLATRSVSNFPIKCNFSYTQISKAINRPSKHVHRCLFRLVITGCLQALIPVWYGELTPLMEETHRTMTVISPPRSRHAFKKRGWKMRVGKMPKYGNNNISSTPNINLLDCKLKKAVEKVPWYVQLIKNGIKILFLQN